MLKAGGAFLPLDLDYPAARLALMLGDAAPHVVLTSDALRDDLPADDETPRLVIDDPRFAAELDAGGDDPPPAPALELAHPAYVIYTSGSTGRPKGVVVTHSGLASLVATAVDRLGVGAGDHVAQFASMSFDVAVWDLCMSLLTGACLVVVPAERRVPGPPLLDYLRDHRISHMILPPSLVAALPEEAELPAGARLVVGAERVPPEIVERWSGRLQIVGAYGLTETTVNSTLWLADAGWSGDSVPIGRPDPNTSTYVLDEALAPCRRARSASCTSAATASRAATWVGRTSPPSASSPIRSGRRGRACTAPATSSAGGRTGASSSSGVPTSR